ncbi:hypothetical protein [Listeria monocytogenes]|uniref:hypothetical protein n=1 Tax=Listeria monocytogenes TaxID=1639 RepID=UPI000F0F86D1|nr:hypothetical protein [Listeria monocytogenes]MCQ54864.1 hypothetical protein [Listeria monocytogenes]TYV72788.1 hypothetical protein FZ077_05610 [Listeria monocytogenes]
MNKTSSELKADFPELNFVIDNKLPTKLFAIIQSNVVHLQPALTESELRCTIIEEVMHWKYTAGDITNYNDVKNIKQEKFARRKAHDYLVTIDVLASCYDRGIRTYHEAATFLNITEKFLIEVIENYREKYGLMYKHGEYIINFGSTIQIFQEDNSFYPYDYGC